MLQWFETVTTFIAITVFSVFHKSAAGRTYGFGPVSEAPICKEYPEQAQRKLPPRPFSASVTGFLLQLKDEIA